MPKILFLHGFCQNATIFSTKISVLRKLLIKNGFELVFAEGTVVIPGGIAASAIQRGWWREENKKYLNFDKSREKLINLSDHHAGFDGVVGFSQGAAMAALMAFDLKPKFIILVSGFIPRDESLLSVLYGSNRSDVSKDDWKSQLKILNVIGSNDMLVDKQISLDLASLFESYSPGNSTILMHDGGHLVPLKAAYKQEMYDFIIKSLNE